MNTPLNRRHFLRSTSVLMVLPTLQSLGFRAFAASKPLSPPQRLVAVHLPLGMMPRFFFPTKPGEGAAAPKATPPSSPYLDLLAELRGHFTAFSGLSHPGVGGGHAAHLSFLTGAPGTGQPGFRNTQSLDQFVAERIGQDTRFLHLGLGVQKRTTSDSTQAVSFTRRGVAIPTELSPKQLYRRMFATGTADEQAATVRRIEAGGSVLDLVSGRAKVLEGSIDAEDRARLDQYFTSVRELEGRLKRAMDWEKRPKPAVNYSEPRDIDDVNFVIEKSKLMFDLMRLALQTDSTRVITLHISTFNTIAHVPGVKTDTHSLSHHGNEPEKIAELRKVEEAQMKVFVAFLKSLRDVGEQGGSLLDHTQVLYGSCLGNANAHANNNLPIILAGGGYRHPGHLAFDEKNNEPLANLYVTMLQRLGIETDTFSTGKHTLRGLNA